MSKLIWLSCIAIVLFIVLAKLNAWMKNRAVAKTSGFPVFLSPVHIADLWWMAIYPMVWNIWKAGYAPFDRAGSDSFILSTPNGNVLWSCDPAIIKAAFTQSDKSHMPVEMMRFFDLWGPTLSSTEGAKWKTSRRIIASGFNPSTNQSVWEETRRQCGMILHRWADNDGLVKVMKDWTSPLALHVISAVFFDKQIGWNPALQDAENLPQGHKLSYEKSLFGLLEKLGILAITPAWLRGRVPLESVQKASLAYDEFSKYMFELCDYATLSIQGAEGKRRKNMLETIVAASNPEAKEKGIVQTEENIMGNMFFTLMAGHETVGNSLSFLFMLLAIYPEHQQRVHDELDEVLGDCSPEEADLQLHFNKLHEGFVGAVIKETLRLYNPAQFNLRTTVAPLPVVDSKGKRCVIPPNTTCVQDFAAAFRNPNTWARKEGVPASRRLELHDSPALDWDPARWLEGSDGSDLEHQTSDGEALIYFPFGQGGRACLGKSFALIEMVAAIMTLLKNHNLELSVQDSTVSECGGDKQLAWEKTRDIRILMLIDAIEPNISIQMLKELPLRCTKRSSAPN